MSTFFDSDFATIDVESDTDTEDTVTETPVSKPVQTAVIIGVDESPRATKSRGTNAPLGRHVSQLSSINIDLRDVVDSLRIMPNARLRELCVRSEWKCATRDAERQLIKNYAKDPSFWESVESLVNAEFKRESKELGSVWKGLDYYAAELFHCFIPKDELESEETRLRNSENKLKSVDCATLHQMLLYMGMPVTESEVEKIISIVAGPGAAQITEAHFIQIMKNINIGDTLLPTHADTLRRASFRVTVSRQHSWSCRDGRSGNKLNEKSESFRRSPLSGTLDASLSLRDSSIRNSVTAIHSPQKQKVKRVHSNVGNVVHRTLSSKFYSPSKSSAEKKYV